MSDVNKRLFMAGYYMAYAVTYFNKVLIVSQLSAFTDKETVATRDKMMVELKESGSQFVTMIKEASNIASFLQIGTPPLPKFPDDYFNWVSATIKAFDNKYPVMTVEGMLFHTGFDLGNIGSNCSIINTCFEIENQTNLTINKTDQIQLLIKDIFNSDYILAGRSLLLARLGNIEFVREEWLKINQSLNDDFPEKEKYPESKKNIYQKNFQKLQNTSMLAIKTIAGKL